MKVLTSSEGEEGEGESSQESPHGCCLSLSRLGHGGDDTMFVKQLS